MNYRPRTQSKKFRDGDCPDGVLAIYDNGGSSFDRYTVFYKLEADAEKYMGSYWITYRGMSEHPASAQGFGIVDTMKAHEAAAYRNRVYRHSAKWSDLPDDVKECVRRDCMDWYGKL